MPIFLWVNNSERDVLPLNEHKFIVHMYTATTLLIVSSDKCLYTLKHVLRVTLDTSTLSLLMVSRNENTHGIWILGAVRGKSG